MAHEAAFIPTRPPKSRYLPLDGDALERYAATASALILAARLNKWYPDPFGCADRLRFLSPSLRRGVYDGIFLDRTNGLPRHQDILTVQVDRQIAEDFIYQQQSRIAVGRRLTPRVEAKLRYYQELVKVPPIAMTDLQVKLRRVFPERGTAAFEVVLDRFDPGEGVFVRYTLLIEQTDSMWGGGLLERTGDYTRQTGVFRAAMEKYAQDESEIMFLLLGKLDGVRVEEVARGRVGPLWTPWSPAPRGWFPEDPSDAFVLHCPLDRASTGHEIDLDNDPFSTLYSDFLSDKARPIIEEAASRYGYRVHKERKFACTKSALEPLKAKLKQAGTKNVLYTI